MDTSDSYDLDRFVEAQRAQYAIVIAELRNGRKVSHWMWYFFPQLSGLGYSSMANRYGIASLEEAIAYLNHPVLGVRLRECTAIVNDLEDRSAGQIFGHTDALKFHSSMTLFAQATPEEPLFKEALAKYFGGQPDNATLRMLSAAD